MCPFIITRNRGCIHSVDTKQSIIWIENTTLNAMTSQENVQFCLTGFLD